MKFHELQPGTLFVITKDTSRSAAVKLDDKHALFLASGEKECIRWNKAVEPPGTLHGDARPAYDADGKLCYALKQGQGRYWCAYPIVLHYVNQDSENLEFPENTGEVQRLKTEVNIMLRNLQKTLDNALTMAKAGEILLKNNN